MNLIPILTSSNLRIAFNVDDGSTVITVLLPDGTVEGRLLSSVDTMMLLNSLGAASSTYMANREAVVRTQLWKLERDC